MPDAPDHELEVLLIDYVKTDECSKKFDIYLGGLFCSQHIQLRWRMIMMYEQGFQVVQCLKYDPAIFVVIILGTRESSFVDAGVQVGHHPTVHFINLRPQRRRVKVELFPEVIYWQEIIKSMVQHPHDVFTLIVDDLASRLVP